MTVLYTRTKHGATFRWSPPDTSVGKQAVESVIGGVEEFPADVTGEDADAIRDEYERLIGGSA